MTILCSVINAEACRESLHSSVSMGSELKMLVLLLACALVAHGAMIKKGYIPTEFQPLSQEVIDFVNSQKDSTWKAGRNFEGVSVHYLKGLMGVIEDPNGPRLTGIQSFFT